MTRSIAPKRLLVLALLVASPTRAQPGVIITLAGTTPPYGIPVRGFSGDGGLATNAALALANVQNICDPNQFEQTVHLWVDAAGNIYFPDSGNQRIRRLAPDGIITTVAGIGDRPQTDAQCQDTGPVGDGGPALSAHLYNPADALLSPNGNLIVADQQNNRIRRVTPDAVISTIAGSGMHNLYAPGIPATDSPMDWPGALAVDAGGNLYFAEVHGNRVGRIGADGRILTVAGIGFPGYNGDNIPATLAELKSPTGIALDAAGNLFIADRGNHRIRKVAPDGRISTAAGIGQAGFSGDGGPASAAALNTPMDVKVDGIGNIYIADAGNHRVRRVSTDGTISTIAGDGFPGRGPDGVPSDTSSLNSPAGLAIDANNDLYIVDWQNYLIRQVVFTSGPVLTPGGTVNAASLAPPPAPLAPGSLISISGFNLAPSSASSSDSPLPLMLAGTSVLVNSAAIPLASVSPDLIQAQLPYELAPGPASLTVVNGDTPSRPSQIHVAPAAPGIFVNAGTNHALALNQDGTANSPGNPASPGATISVLLTGQGNTANTMQAIATIGGLPAQIVCLYPEPGSPGVTRAVLLIPSAAAAGDQDLVITIGGEPSNDTVVSLM